MFSFVRFSCRLGTKVFITVLQSLIITHSEPHKPNPHHPFRTTQTQSTSPIQNHTNPIHITHSEPHKPNPHHPFRTTQTQSTSPIQNHTNPIHIIHSEPHKPNPHHPFRTTQTQSTSPIQNHTDPIHITHSEPHRPNPHHPFRTTQTKSTSPHFVSLRPFGLLSDSFPSDQNYVLFLLYRAYYMPRQSHPLDLIIPLMTGEKYEVRTSSCCILCHALLLQT